MSERPGLVLSLDDGREIPLAPTGKSLLGSSPEADVVLDGLADLHCAIGRLPRGGYALRDLGSRAGCRVNGTSVTSARLLHGDRVELGPVRFAILDPGLESLEPEQDAVAESPSEEPDSDEIVLDEADDALGAEPIPGFRILRPLGRGAHGEVVLAVQQSLGRRVALKLLARDLARDRAFVERFHSEARAAASLSHPNVVVVHDVGTAGDRHFLAMEFMEGGTLEARVRRHGPLPWREVVACLSDAAAALAYAEQRGIVHRDVKPDNLMRSATGTVKLADLGLAHPIGKRPGDGAVTVAGTPHFIAPEQARGLPADQRSDLYSLGATAFRLLTGRTPFSGSTTREILQAVFTAPTPSVLAFAPEAPPPLAALVLRLMEKDPERRPASAREVAAELERIRLFGGAGADEPAPRRARLVLVALCLAVLLAAIWVVAETLGSAPAPTPSTAGAAAVESADSVPIARPTFDDQEPRSDARNAEVDPLEELEREAERALAEVTQPGGEARAAALALLAERYRGTDAAERARTERDELVAELARTAGARDARERTRLRLLADLDERTAGASPPETLRAVREVYLPPSVREDAELARALGARERAVVDAALDRLREAHEAADRAADEGAFDRIPDLLRAALASVDAEELVRVVASTADAPDRPGGVGPGDAAALGALRDRLELRLEGLDAERAAHRQARALADARRRAEVLVDVEADLRAMRLDGAAERLATLVQRLETDGERARVSELAASVERAAAALGALRRALANDRWRRHSVSDPRPGVRAVREVVGADALGLRLEGDGDGADVLAWSDLFASPDALDGLFKSRLARAYTDEELAGVAALLRLSAVVLCGDVLRPEVESLGLAQDEEPLDERERDRMTEALDTAADWAERAGSGERLLAERAAVRETLDVLAAAERRSWAEAVELLEELLARRGDTLFVLLLSEGR